MNKILLPAMLAFFLTCSCSRCFEDCGNGALEFDLPLKVYGVKDTIGLGDTLRIRLDVPDRLVERSNGELYSFIDYDFELISYIGRVDSMPTVADTKLYFNWIDAEGESTYFGGVYIISPKYHDNTYQYEALIIPKQKGLYVFGMNSDFSRASPLAKLDGPCSKRPVYVYMKLENLMDVNFEFLQYSPEPVYINLDRKRFDEFAGFCFYVR